MKHSMKENNEMNPLHQTAARPKKWGVTIMAAGVALATAAGVMLLTGNANPDNASRVVRYTAPSAASYTAQAAQLGDKLNAAIAKDLKMTGAQYLALADAGRSAAATVKSLGSGVKASWIDKSGTLHVIAEDETTAQLAQAAGAEATTKDPLGDKAEAEQSADSSRTYWADYTDNTVKSYDKSSLKFTSGGLADGNFIGGTGYMVTTTSGGNARCSAGFAGTDGYGQTVDLTAGHCVESDDTSVQLKAMTFPVPTAYLDREWGLDDARDVIGRAAQGHAGDEDDGGIINLSESAYKVLPQVSTWGADGKEVAETKGEGLYSQDDGTPLDVYDASDVVIGMPACKSGSTSGWTCGTIKRVNVSEQVNGTNGISPVSGFQFDACMLSGDSGGAIVSGHYAIGVDSYGNMDTCDDSYKDDAVAGGYAVIAGDYNAEKMFGDNFNLSVVVGKPEIAAKAAADGSVSGTVAAAEGAKLDVTIDGTKYSTVVRFGGKWSVKPAKKLASGSHDVTATASLRAAGSSLVTTGETATGVVTVA